MNRPVLPLALDFVVIGGGVAGLAVAYVLSQTGHRVRVLERRNLDVPSAGIRIPPNLSKILRRWVGDEALGKVSTRCVGSPFIRLRTGETAGYLHWRPAIMAETGGEFLLMSRKDLICMLHELATSAGARVQLNTAVTSVQPGTANPTVLLSTGETITPDIVIGADGSNSMVREVVLDGEEPCVAPGGLTLYTGSVNMDEILKDPELIQFVNIEEWPMWMGDNAFMGTHMMSNNKELHVGMYYWHKPSDVDTETQESWQVLVSPESVISEQHAPAAQRLIKMVSRFTRAEYLVCDGEHEWVDDSGRIVLLGDAAHPSIPGGTHTASMAVEDAVVLGALFSRLKSTEQIAPLLSAYQELRQPRTHAVGLGDFGNAQMVSWPPGPMADARDASMARKQDEWDEGAMKAGFEQIAEIFVYDASDAAEEWWIDWGRWQFPEGATSSDEAGELPWLASQQVIERELSV